MSKLRFGIMVDGDSLKQWQVNAIQQLLDAYVAEPILVIKNGSPTGNPPIGELLGNGLFYVYKKFFANATSLESRPFPEQLNTAETINCTVSRKGKFSEYFSSEDLDTIKSHNLDFILRFGFGIIRGEIHNATKYGIWSFHHGDEQKYRGGPYCFWEVFYQDRLTGSILQRLTDKLDGGIVLKKGQFGTVRHSYAANIEQALSASSDWPKQVCIDINNGKTDHLNSDPSPTDAPIYKLPGNLRMIQFFFIQAFAFGKHWYEKISGWDHWGVGFVNASVGQIIENKGIKAEWMDWVHPEKGSFIADPSLYSNGETSYLLCEKLDYSNPLGFLTFQTIENGKVGQESILLKEPHHLSYPRLILENGETFMIPETSDAGCVQAYRMIGELGKWDAPTTLIPNLKGIDPTVFKHDGKWWMFVSTLGDGHAYKLLLYYSEELLGTWKAHSNNPVKFDVRTGRGGGGVFNYENQLYRPGQDYSEKHEGALNLFKIKKLTTTEYEEDFICHLGPIKHSPFPDKIHTIDVVGDRIVIDACKEMSVLFRPNLFALKWKLLRHKSK
ncbi:MAG: hypothetical protein ACI9FU_000336 [Granulosicoccus sp.]|jgi:hypothetical protein